MSLIFNIDLYSIYLRTNIKDPVYNVGQIENHLKNYIDC